MGCRRPVSLIFRVRIVLLFVLLSVISLIPSPDGMALADERTPVRAKGTPSARDQQGGFAEAAKIVAERLAASFPRVEGLIIGFEGDLVLIDRGTAAGVVQGMELDVFREGEEFKHPLTGETLGRLDKDLGTVRVLHVHERYAETAVIKKAEKVEFRKGDRVRVSMARMIVAFPNIDVGGVGGVSARSMTKDLAAALVRTGRFEPVEDRQLRSMLLTDREFMAGELADPKTLKQLADRGKIQVLLLSRLTPSADGISLDVQAYSTLTGNSIVLASAPLQLGITSRDQPPRRPEPPVTARPAVKTPPDISKPTTVSPSASSRPSITSVPSEHVVLEPAFDGAMTAMAVGDLDGDGKRELLVAGSDRLLAFRFDGSHLKSLAEYPLREKGSVVALEAMDVTGDGGTEIIMTLSHKGRFHALVVQWTGGKLRAIWEVPDLIIRPLASDGKTSQLFGQTVVSGDQTAKPIRQYTWDGRDLQPGPALDIPAGLSLLELMMADLSGDGAVSLVTFQRGTALEVRSRTGEPIGAYEASGGVTTSPSRAGLRVLIEKERDGTGPLLILGRGEEAEPRLFGRWTGSKVVNLIVLKWNGAGFHKVWQAPISDGTLADYAVADLGEGLGRRLLALVVKRGRLGLGTRSEIQAFRY
ncbi:MAG TPA: VCBS repeat-containing protein [Patescibacteria group bacterium]|nr:VCBS repeat-containing protein [Patescibacteria group bacterium]